MGESDSSACGSDGVSKRLKNPFPGIGRVVFSAAKSSCPLREKMCVPALSVTLQSYSFSFFTHRECCCVERLPSNSARQRPKGPVHI